MMVTHHSQQKISLTLLYSVYILPTPLISRIFNYILTIKYWTSNLLFLTWHMKSTETANINTRTQTERIIAIIPNRLLDHEKENSSNFCVTSEKITRQITAVANPLTQLLEWVCKLLRKLGGCQEETTSFRVTNSSSSRWHTSDRERIYTSSSSPFQHIRSPPKSPHFRKTCKGQMIQSRRRGWRKLAKTLLSKGAGSRHWRTFSGSLKKISQVSQGKALQRQIPKFRGRRRH